MTENLICAEKNTNNLFLFIYYLLYHEAECQSYDNFSRGQANYYWKFLYEGSVQDEFKEFVIKIPTFTEDIYRISGLAILLIKCCDVRA